MAKPELKLTQEELRYYNFRKGLIDQKNLELSLLNREFLMYQKELMENHSLDSSKEYSIGDGGVLVEKKKPTLKAEPKKPAKGVSTEK